MHLSKEDETAVQFIAFEKAFLKSDMYLATKLAFNYATLRTFLSFYAVRVTYTHKDPARVFSFTIPRFIQLAEYLFLYDTKLYAIQILLWTLAFAREYSLAGEVWIIRILARQLAGELLQRAHPIAANYLAPIRQAFQEEQLALYLPEALMEQGDVVGLRKGYELTRALYLDKPSYALGPGHAKLAERIYTRLLEIPGVNQEDLLSRLETTRFVLEIWDGELAGKRSLYTPKRQYIVDFLRTMFS